MNKYHGLATPRIDFNNLHSSFYIFSIIGGIIVIAGLYLLLWGKENDEKPAKIPDEECTGEQENPTKLMIPQTK